MFSKVAFTMYPVADMSRASAFYESVIGLTPGSDSESGNGGWVEYDLPGGGCLAITTFTQAKPGSGEGGMIAFEVDNLDAVIAELEAKDVSFASDMIHSPVCRMRVCKDSEGNAFLLHQLNRK